MTSFIGGLLLGGEALLCHPHDIVQLEQMISVDRPRSADRTDDSYLRCSLNEPITSCEGLLYFHNMREDVCERMRICMAAVCERFLWIWSSNPPLLFVFFSSVFFKGYQSQGQTPWTRGTSRTTILDPQWTTPLDAHRAASCISLSFILSQPAALMSCQAVPPPPTASISPPSLLPAGGVLTLKMAAVTNMTHLFQTLLTPHWPPSIFLIETNGLRAINYHRAPFLQPATCLAPR